MRVRPAVAADTGAIRQLVRRAFLPYVDRIGAEPRPMHTDYDRAVAAGQCWVAEDDGHLVGMIHLVDPDGHLEVETVAVDPQAHGRGIGTGLLRFAEEHAAARGLREIRLYTNELMTENLAFYPRRGFREIGRFTVGVYRRVQFAKDLSPPTGSSPPGSA